jgi:hypothetical protein
MTTVLSVEAGGLRLRHRFGTAEEELAADCVVLADHELPDDALYHGLVGALHRVEVRRVGDCVAPRRVLHAVLEGSQVGRSA